MSVKEIKVKNAKEMEQKILDLLKEGVTVLTQNPRLNRRLSHFYRLSKLEEKRGAWEAPSIYSFRFFVDKTYEDLWREKRQLSFETSLLLWMDIMEKRERVGNLTVSSDLALEFQRTFDFMENWGLSCKEEPDGFFAERKEIFREYSTRVSSEGFITFGAAISEVKRAIEEKEIDIPANIAVVGREGLTRIETDFMDFLGQRSEALCIDIYGANEEIGDARFEKIGGEVELFKNYENETEAILGRVIEDWEKGERSIGVVYFEDKYKEKLERLLVGLEKKDGVKGAPFPDGTIIGVNIQDSPHFQAVKLLLSLKQGVPDENLRSLVLSPVFNKRPLFDAVNWADKIAKFIKRDFNRGIKEYKNKYEFGDELDPFVATVSLEVSKWVEKTFKLLEHLGYGAGEADYISCKVVEAVRGRLDFLRIEMGKKTVTLDRFRTIFECVSSRDVIKEPNDEFVGVQIMPYRESFGMTFNRLYLLGCHQGVLPQPPQKYPFLHNQEKTEVAILSAVENYSVCRKFFRSVISGGEKVLLSRPVEDEAAPVLASPFLKDGKKEDRWDIYTSGGEGLLGMNWLRGVRGVKAGRNNGKVPGGGEDRTLNIEKLPSRLNVAWDLMALIGCPYKFFMQSVLEMKGEDEVSIMLDKKERGTLMHAIVGACAKAIKGLTDKSDGNVRAAMENAADNAIRESRFNSVIRSSLNEFLRGREGKPGFLEKLFVFEKKRMGNGWLPLLVEQDFGTVQLEEFEFGLSGRLDRLDRHAGSGRTALLEMKSRTQYKKTDLYQAGIYKLMAPASEALAKDAGERVTPSVAFILPLLSDPLKEKEVLAETEIMDRIKFCCGELKNGSIKADPFPPPGEGSESRRGDPCEYCPFDLLCGIGEDLATEGESNG